MYNKPIICCCAINDILVSIALEETALAHILNAEGEKIQKGLSTATSIDELIRINCSVQKTIVDITSLENVLYNKLQLVLSCECEDCPQPCEKGSLKVCVFSCCSGEPICNAYVKVCLNSDLIGEGKTDARGCYCLECLQNGEYKVEVFDPSSGDREIFVICITDNQKHVSKKICLKNNPEKHICISGEVLDSCGNVLCNATVVAIGAETKTVQTNKCGCFEIKNLSVCDKFSIYAKFLDKKSNVICKTDIEDKHCYSVKIII